MFNKCVEDTMLSTAGDNIWQFSFKYQRGVKRQVISAGFMCWVGRAGKEGQPQRGCVIGNRLGVQEGHSHQQKEVTLHKQRNKLENEPVDNI